MGEYRIGHSYVAFRIFEINGVYFVGHGGTANLARKNLLLEIPHRDILPQISARVQQNGVHSHQIVAEGSQIIVMFNLGGVAITG